jgi:hypothetical protein
VRGCLSHLLMCWHRSHIAPFHFFATLNAYATCTWKIMHLVKLQHSDLPQYLGLTSTSRQVGLIFDADFPSDPRPCCSGLPTPVFRPNRKLHLVRRLSALQLMLRTPFLKLSLVGTYATCEYVKSGVEPNPTFRFVTQAAMGVAPWWFELGPQLGEPHI